MGRLGKRAAFCIVVILLSSCLFMAEPSFAQTKPSVPQFSLSIQDNAVVLSIANQPFDVHNSDNYTFYYDVRVMSAGGYWVDFPGSSEQYPCQLESANTTFTYPIGKSSLFPILTTVGDVPIPASGEAAFQVMALVGTLQKSYSYPDGTNQYGLVGQVSSWSSSQTINLSSNQSSPNSYVSPTGGMSTQYRLTMFSPNSQTVNDGILPLQFMLYWTYDLMPLFEPQTTYAYSIDGNPFVGLTANKTSTDGPGHGYTFVNNPSFSYMLDVSNLVDGVHKIEIRAIFNFGHTLLNDTSTAFSFTVNNSNPHITPPSTSTALPSVTSPASSTSANATPTVPEFPFAASSVAALTVVTALLVSLKKKLAAKSSDSGKTS